MAELEQVPAIFKHVDVNLLFILAELFYALHAEYHGRRFPDLWTHAQRPPGYSC